MAHMKKATSEHDQLNADKGIKRFGQSAIDVVLAEFVQLSGYTTFDGLDPNKLTRKQKCIALNLITIIKKKCCGKIKG